MTALRYALARLGGTGQRIALDKRHPLEGVGQDACSEETGDASTGNHGVVKRTARHGVASMFDRKDLRLICPSALESSVL